MSEHEDETPSAEDAARAARAVSGEGGDEGDEGGAERRVQQTLPFLTKAAMLPVEDVVYCLTHTAVHEATEDPYGSGVRDCLTRDHRPVYYRARKGDPNVREDDGPEIKQLVIAAGGEGLSAAEKGVLAGLVRVQIRKVRRNKQGAAKLFGDEYDPTLHDNKLALLEGAYRRLGGDPARITTRESREGED